MKKCIRCGAVQTSKNTYRRRSGTFQSECKECLKKGTARISKLRYRRNPILGLCTACSRPTRPGKRQCIKCARRGAIYRLDVIASDKLKAKQASANFNGLCSICGFPTAGHLDHNHKTRRFRAILCGGCNWIIGHCRENPETLFKIARYLRKWRQL